MVSFFIQLYFSIFQGEWTALTANQARSILINIRDDLGNLLVNTLGGHFQEIETFTWKSAPVDFICGVLAIITIIMICFAVFGIVKKIFSIFFVGVR